MHLWVRELSQMKDTIRSARLTNGLYGYGTREIEIKLKEWPAPDHS